MSITDAKDVPSWQIGFEDGIKFVLNNFNTEFRATKEPEWKWAKLEKPPLFQTVWLKFDSEIFNGFRANEFYQASDAFRILSLEHAENNGLMWKELESC